MPCKLFCSDDSLSTDIREHTPKLSTTVRKEPEVRVGAICAIGRDQNDDSNSIDICLCNERGCSAVCNEVTHALESPNDSQNDSATTEVNYTPKLVSCRQQQQGVGSSEQPTP